jgi:hypothetical protein
MKKALICGVSGQDGAYLAQLLLTKGMKSAVRPEMPRCRVLLTWSDLASDSA